MGIRFYIPLPGPFAYVPGKKHPKPRSDESTAAAAGNLASSIVNRGQKVYDNAIDYAISNDIDDPKLFATRVLNTVTTNWKIAYTIGFAATIAFWFWQMQFGALLLILVPLLNLATIVPAVIIGATVSTILHRGNQVHDEIASRHT